MAAVRAFPDAGAERTLFKDLAADDPAREVIATVLAGRTWADDALREAWERARSYFPGRTWLVVPGTHFMAHGFDPDGELFMEVHESAFLTLCAANARTFRPGSVVADYARMRREPDGREAAAFREKTGRLEPRFRDEASLGLLAAALGRDGYGGLLRALREEDHHMLAGGLMHEGVHAGLGDALAARVRSGFEAGELPVQWDETRSFMAETAFHGLQARRFGEGLAAGRERTAALLGRLEPLRRKGTLGRAADRAAYETLAAGLGAEIALGRVRMRELWQSVRRVEGLLGNLRRDYVRPGAPGELEGPLAALERDATRFAAAAGEAIGAYELALRDIETLLGQWDEWAAGTRPFPPPVTDSKAIVRRAGAVVWPAPPVDGALSLMRLAGRALDRERSPS